jgi:hypothetical protein
MLCVNTYAQRYIDDCRKKVDVQLSAFRKLVKTARTQVGTDGTPLNSSIEAFEPIFFNNMVLVLESYFVHRSRTIEKKDGNPLNEVRVLCDSLMQSDGVMRADEAIKLDPTKSVLKYHVGDEIRIREAVSSACPRPSSLRLKRGSCRPTM